MRNLFVPPTREETRQNLRLFLADWKRGDFLMRYFIVSQLASGGLLMACSFASIAALAAGQRVANVVLLGVATLALMHAVTNWNVLTQRYRVRFQIW